MPDHFFPPMNAICNKTARVTRGVDEIASTITPAGSRADALNALNIRIPQSPLHPKTRVSLRVKLNGTKELTTAYNDTRRKRPEVLGTLACLDGWPPNFVRD